MKLDMTKRAFEKAMSKQTERLRRLGLNLEEQAQVMRDAGLLTCLVNHSTQPSQVVKTLKLLINSGLYDRAEK